MSIEAPKELTRDDLEELLQSKVESFMSSSLTGPGENFGSLLLLIDATLLPDRRKLSIAAKLVVTKNLMGGVPPFRDFVRKEIDMYVRLRPEILAIQEEYKVPKDMLLDVIPRCYGARTTRGGGIDQPVDVTAVILMENLKASGYRLVDRIVGMDLKHSECVVKHLARFQAMFVVFKLKKPEFFKHTVLPVTSPIKHDGPPPKFAPTMDPKTELLSTLANVPAVIEHIDRLVAFMTRPKSVPHSSVREPYATLVHNDFWTNNVMFSYNDSEEEIKDLKLIDFQMTSYGSPASDLLFFLYSSTSLEVTKEDRFRLIKLYHQEFVKWLELFHCDIRPFSYDTFLKEVDTEAPMAFNKAFRMLRIFCMSRSNAPDINDPDSFQKMKTDNTGLGKDYFEKIERIVKEFVEKDWI